TEITHGSLLFGPPDGSTARACPTRRCRRVSLDAQPGPVRRPWGPRRRETVHVVEEVREALLGRADRDVGQLCVDLPEGRLDQLPAQRRPEAVVHAAAPEGQMAISQSSSCWPSNSASTSQVTMSSPGSLRRSSASSSATSERVGAASPKTSIGSIVAVYLGSFHEP